MEFKMSNNLLAERAVVALQEAGYRAGIAEARLSERDPRVYVDEGDDGAVSIVQRIDRRAAQEGEGG